jgi:tRNA(fMet)-specific endonuclease VapC
MIIFDSTVLIDLFKGNNIAEALIAEVTDSPLDEAVATTAVSYYEVFTGIKHRDSRKEDAFFRQFFTNIEVLDLDRKAAEEASKIMARLLSKGCPVKPLDALIAGIAKANGATKIIAGDRHFECISEVVDFEIVVYNAQKR